MTTIALTVAVGCALFGGPGSERGPTLEDLAFMAGAWEAEEGAQHMREVWDAPLGDAMVGHFIIVEGGEVALYELLTVEMEEAGPVMRLRHFGRGLEPWASEAAGPLSFPLKEVGEGRAVFEDPQREFPRRVVYSLEGEEMTVRLEPAEGSEREELVLLFEKAGE